MDAESCLNTLVSEYLRAFKSSGFFSLIQAWKAALCKYLISVKKFATILVRLSGGAHDGEGNVYAYNPTTEKEGPICDDYWDIKAVSIKLVHWFLTRSNKKFLRRN